MAALIPPGATPASPASLTPRSALLWAWRIWSLIPVIPCLLSIDVVWRAASQTAPHPDASLAEKGFIAVLAYAAIVIPAGLFWRARLFRAYAAGGVVPPRNYLIGLSALWLALASVGCAAAIVCLLSGKLMPTFGFGAATLLFYFILWPTGTPMIRATGQTEDPELHEEPR